MLKTKKRVEKAILFHRSCIKRYKLKVNASFRCALRENAVFKQEIKNTFHKRDISRKRNKLNAENTHVHTLTIDGIKYRT